MHRKDTASSPHAPHYKPIQHPTGLVQHTTFNILNTPHYKSLSTCEKICFLSAALAARSVLLTSSPNGICVDLRSVGEIFPCRMPHSKSNIPHSTFSTSLPQIYTVFPVAHRLASKYAILAHFCNHLTFSRLPFEGPILLSPLLIQPCG